MYSSQQLNQITENFDREKEKIITEVEDYCTDSWSKINTVIPLYRGLVFNFETATYEAFHISNFPLQTEVDFKNAFIRLCRLKYQVGYPTVFSILAFPFVAEIEYDRQIVTQPLVLMFIQTEIHSKYGVYQYIDGKMQLNERYTKSFWPKSYMMNLGFIHTPVPTQS